MFKAGVARFDITPKVGIGIGGSLTEIISRDIHDRLFVNSLVLDNGKEKVAIVSCDLCLIEGVDVRTAANLIREKTGIPETNLMVHATHTHFAPATANLFQTKKKKVYMAEVVKKIAGSVVSANQSMRGAKIGVEKNSLSSLTTNREIRLKDGSVTVQARWLLPKEKVAGFAGPIDPEVGVVAVKDLKDNLIAVLVNFACHPWALGYDCGPGTPVISADYVAYLRETIERKHENCVTLFLNGACGDIDPKFEPKVGAKKLGTVLGEKVLETLRKMDNFHTCVPLRAVRKEVTIPLRKIADFQEKAVRKEFELVAPHWGLSIDEAIRIFREDFNYLKRKGEKSVKTCLQVIFLSTDTILINVPGEFYTEYGLELKKMSGFKNTFVVELTNDYIGYIPTKIRFKEGGYGVLSANSSKVAPTAGEMIVRKALKILSEMVVKTSKGTTKRGGK